MAAGIGIDAEVEVVLVVSHLYHCIQVTTLEVALEGQLLLCTNSWIHSSEDACVFRFEVGVKFAEVGCHMRVACISASFVFEGVGAWHFQVHFKTTAEPLALLSGCLPRKITLSLCLEPKEVSSSMTWSRRCESQFNGIGPMTLFLGRQPVIISASREYCLFAISTAGKWLRTVLGGIYNPWRGRLPVPLNRTSPI